MKWFFIDGRSYQFWHNSNDGKFYEFYWNLGRYTKVNFSTSMSEEILKFSFKFDIFGGLGLFEMRNLALYHKISPTDLFASTHIENKNEFSQKNVFWNYCVPIQFSITFVMLN